MLQEALNNVVVADWEREERGEPNQERSNGKNHEVEVVLETSAPEAETNWKKERWQDGVGETVLRVPLSTAAASHPQGSLVVEKVSIDLRSSHTNPSGHCEECEIERRESVTAGNLWRNEVGGQSRCLHNWQTKRNEDVGAHEQRDWRESDLEGNDGAFDLLLTC